MDSADVPVLTRNSELTSQEDKKGVEVFICDPPWFDEKKMYRIANAPKRTAELEFDGSDLNFMARVLYAEASGSLQIQNKKLRDMEKAAIMNVNHFRLNRRGYPTNSYVALNFRAVCLAPAQFESVSETNRKFTSTVKSLAGKLKKIECIDLCEAVDAVSEFMKNGPCSDYQFDNFRGYRPNGQGQHIGRSRFWLSCGGATLLAEVP